jgi:inner membrane transporter RhtA
MPASTLQQRLGALPPEALFVVSAVSQYTGAAIAVGLFDEVEPRQVAWFRVLGATVALLAVSPGFHRGWTRRALAGAAVFGTATALMNLFFYLAIARLDLGSGVAIEFVGPIAVAAATTRTRRNALALGVAAVGVITLGGLEIGDNTTGLLFILASSAMWAAYIVVGSKVANVRSGVAGLGVGLAIGTVVLAPVGLPGSGHVWTSASLLVLCVLSGVFSNAIGYGIDQYVLRRVPVRRFSLLLATLPVTAVLVGWIALDQRPGPVEVAGIGLVLVAVALQDRESLVSEMAAPEPS